VENIHDICVQNFPHESVSEKNFVNRSAFAEVMIRSQVYCLFDSHCTTHMHSAVYAMTRCLPVTSRRSD